MGRIFNGACLPDGLAAAEAWCSTGWPRMTQNPDGTFAVKSCTAIDPAWVSIASPDTPASGTAGDCTGGTLEYSTTRASDGAVSTLTAYFPGTATDSPSALTDWFAANIGATNFVISGGDSSGAFSHVYNGDQWNGVYYGRTCGAGSVGTLTPAVAGVTQELPVSFPACDYGETYADSTILFGFALAALVIVWALKNFVYKLIANQ